MKKITSVAMMIGGAILASQSAFGQANPNDLYLGFQNSGGGGTQDYIIDLGQASTIIGGASAINLSTYFSLANFNAVASSGTNSVMFGGVVGGSNGGNSSSVYVTQFRNGGVGAGPGTAGSSLTQKFSIFADNTTFAPLTTLNVNALAAGTSILDSTLSWEKVVEPKFTTGSFYGQSGINPDSPINTAGMTYEDLWTTSSSLSANPFTYQGYFALDTTGGSPSLTFTPAAAPEPATWSLIGGGSLLLLALRRRVSRNHA